MRVTTRMISLDPYLSESQKLVIGIPRHGSAGARAESHIWRKHG
jgi:hypothetical protein